MATVAIIDGDVICHHACPPKEKAGITKPIEKFVEINGETKKVIEWVPKDYDEFTDAEKAKYLKISWNNLKANIRKIEEKCYADFSLIAMKSPINYRDWMYPEYKLQRANPKEPRKTNIFVPMLRQMAIDAGLAIEAVGRESDDLLRIWAGEATAAGDTFIICSIDKDLKCIAGMHYLMHKGKEQFMEVSEAEASRFYYEQLLKGDPTDNIPGIPGCGPKTAERLLSVYETEKEFQAAVIDAYQEYYGDAWRNWLLSNGKMIHLQRTFDDHFSVRGWARFAPQPPVW